MGIFKDFFRTIKEKRATKEEEKFNKLDDVEKQILFNKIMEQADNAKVMAGIVEKEPYILPYIIASLKGGNKQVLPLVDIALTKGINIYDLVDKNNNVSNEDIVNLAVANHPEVIFDLEDNKKYSDLIKVETVIEAFRKNPEVMFSDCEVLDAPITLSRKVVCKHGANGKDVYVREYEEGAEVAADEYVTTLTRETTLRTQLKRALNLYFRPEAYSARHFDYYAKAIAEGINGEKFVEKVQGNKMTTRVTTAANETLKRNPEKGKVVPATTLRRWNNRVLYTIPSEARKKLGKKTTDKVKYYDYWQYLAGLLENPSLNSFTEEEKTRLAKRCVSIIPEMYDGLYRIEGYDKIAEKLTVQLSAYEAFKAQGDEAGAKSLLQSLSEQQAKKVLARNKANETRRKHAKEKAKAQELELNN